ncbi:hypothetical protein [Dinghuibacter silviterrae]|uniref:Uncharacterized protein n=1 Tax=Dinghuibacter silviterrae TaxID=1539049 RepID=A0A4R8DHC9_9BACT|nr:hypothetical protein [Dinghuibacter silviterrae]TDW97119.1 hypothetical protein EDB95_4960 [Dinghuibacter silviterrae]
MDQFLLKGGALVIGSLLWDDTATRVHWWDHHVNKALRTAVPLPIRYGRESGDERNHTHTMVFSYACRDHLGMGYALPFRQSITSISDVNTQAIEMMKAERKKSTLAYDEHYNWGWGAMGLLINPLHLEPGSDKYPHCLELAQYWASRMTGGFRHHEYKVGYETSMMEKSGMLRVDWQPELNEFDFVIATAVKAESPFYPNEDEIARRTLENQYTYYFDQNIRHGITTYQDATIIAILTSNNAQILPPENLLQ